MKKILFLLLGTMLVVPAFSQGAFKPKDTWPFLYEDFTEGVVCSLAGSDLLTGELNLSVLNQKLYYIQGEKIMEADMSRVYTARIGSEVYVNVAGKMFLVLAESEGGAAVCSKVLDVDKMNRSNIGYGVSSSVASTQSVSGFALEASANTNLNQALSRKDGGQEIPVGSKMYILYKKNRIVPALKREVMDIPGLDKAAAKLFFKEHKIKWTQPSSLTEVADFLTETIK